MEEKEQNTKQSPEQEIQNNENPSKQDVKNAIKKVHLAGMGYAITSIIFSFLIPLIAFIFGGIGLYDAHRQYVAYPDTPKTVQTLCWVGISLGMAATFFNLLYGMATMQ